MGPTIDHVVALEDGGALLDLANLAPAHRHCNTVKENDRRKRARHTKRLGSTREW